jgi:RNA polymerase sigma factor (sigma-70 family)
MVVSFDEFLDTHYDRMVRVLSLAGGDRDAAIDAVQEACARALARWRRVGNMERPDGWVYMTAVNVLRRRGRLREAALPEHEELQSIAESDPVADAVLTRVAVGASLAKLTARQRQVVVLRCLTDLSTADTARALGCAEGTVKATLHQALTAMRATLEDDDAD